MEGRRFAAGLCAVALMAALVAFPLRARAMAPALPAIGYAVTITAFLAACGIYPFQDEHGQSFGEWGARKLTELWDTYITEVYPTSEAAQVISDVKSFYVDGGYMVMARDTWSQLRSFANWIVDKFSVADNRAGLEIGGTPGDFIRISSVYASPPTFGDLYSSGMYVGDFFSGYHGVYVGASCGDVYFALYGDNITALLSYNDFTGYRYCAHSSHPDASELSYPAATWTPWLVHYGGKTFYMANNVSDGNSYVPYPASGVPCYPDASYADMYAIFTGMQEAESGMMIDTADIAVPAELPEGAELGGLAVAGAGAGAGTLEDVIESGVMERQKPAVRPVEVEIGEGVEVDAGTGTVAEETPSVITITPESVPLSLSDYSIPSLSTVWPFSIPWDIARIYQAFDADPVPPTEFHLSFDFPILSNEPVEINVALPENAQAAFDRTAGIVRAFTLIIACVAYTVWIGKYIRW